MNSLKELAKALKKSKKVALFTHISPDSDALGSVFAMYHALNSLGKQAVIFIEENYSDANKHLIDEKLINRDVCNSADFDTFLCCDASSLQRLGKYADVFDIKNNTIVLDHHYCTKHIARFNHVDASMSSCSELVYELLKIMKVRFNNKILSYIYMGLTSDTNSFINSNTNAHSFKVAYELAKAGVDMNAINEALFRSVTKTEIRFKQFLWTNYKIDKDIAYIIVRYKDLQELQGDNKDCSGYSAKLLTIDKVKYSFSLVEKEPGLISLSMRSRKGSNVRSVAEKLGGGGHICAAGAKFKGTNLNKIKKEIIQSIRDQQ